MVAAARTRRPSAAFAVPSRVGRIAASIGLLAASDDAGRRVLLAHERAHLTHHHRRHQTPATLAAAYPLLTPTRDAVALISEWWAEEDACPVLRDPPARPRLDVPARCGDLPDR
ncbi:M48 family metalloprotease [Frankia sp. AgB1.9]|uniref:M48 family metalloprotease n=1 Tax=unclassified Frankia TaxID=2632575 RepID=UPI0019321DDB|nr:MULTISPECIES: M48 family metalloprotease [unclassified Frankia]MBL7489940.1 M48 family metalloprotease [Frankia sp. AgW1.1]MBL7552671.1 M48 family metalloprotease [Frankia sp. AgB1.9]MBL7623836.1 M48 family metalloprotease [Frankia sp. AgB1.8]